MLAMRGVWLAALMLGGAVLALPASLHAQATAVDFATVSMTNATTPKLVSNSLCYTDGRDIACDRGAFLLSGGLISTTNISVTALTVNGVAVTGSGGVSRLASMTDVTTTGVVSGSVLAYNGTTTSWTAMPVQNVMSTTTMVAGWPDAIVCDPTNPGWGKTVFYRSMDDGTNIQYLAVYNSSYLGYRFLNTTGAYVDYFYTSAGAAGGGDCISQSISQLYAQGKAFNFIGTANTSASTASGDAIISGTTNATVNSATTYISLTTGGSTWGYLSSGTSYLPRLNTAQVSATTISTTAIQIFSPTTALACSSSTAGTIRYNSPTTTLELCTGTGWQPMGVGIPAGTISAFASTTCPVGWSEYTAARGRFLRGIDNGAGNDPSGTRTPGDVQADLFRSHTHTAKTGLSNNGGSTWLGVVPGDYTVGDVDYGGITAAGGGETRPKNVAVTYCQFNGTSNGWNNPLSGGSTVAAGSTSQIQYNTGNAFDASANLTWTNASNRLTATNISATALTVNGVAITGSGGASKLASLTDVAISSPASGSVLAYNGTTTSWTAMPVQNVMSTTTMASGFPDAIACIVSGSKYIYYAVLSPYSNGSYTYRRPAGVTEDVNFTGAGAWSSADVASDCNNQSIAQLYASGKAFNFIGTGPSAADNIASGTTKVTVNNATNTISFTVGGTTTGYMGSSGLLVVPGISATTNQSSFTTGYFSGAVGIGTTNPIQALHVSGAIVTSGTGASVLFYDRTVGVSYSAIFRTGNITRLWDNVAGDVLTYTNTGRVGIGTSNPQVTLDVSSTSGHAIRAITSSNTYAISGQSTNAAAAGVIGYAANGTNYGILGYNNTYAFYGNGQAYVGSANGNAAVYGTNISSGNGVQGMSSGAYGVYGESASTYGVYGKSTSGSYGGVLGYTANSAYYGILGHANAYSFYGQGTLYNSGNAQVTGQMNANVYVASSGAQVTGYFLLASTIGNRDGYYLCWQSADGYVGYGVSCTNSDERLKKDIRPLESSLEKIVKLHGVSFEWKDAKRGTGRKTGLIAQDVEKVFPDLVETTAKSGYKTLQYEKLVAPLIEAVKELKTENDALRARLDALERKIQP